MKKKKIIFAVWTFSISMLLMGSLSGCHTYAQIVGHEFPIFKETTDKRDELVDHRSPLVRYPAITGSLIGFVPGYIITAPCIYMADSLDSKFLRKHDNAAVTLESPVLIFTIMGKYALGGPCWCLFGWWWPEPATTKPVLPQKKEHEIAIPKVAGN